MGDATWPSLIPVTAPTCLCHTGVSPDASLGPGRRLCSTCPAQLPCAPGSLCLPFCLLVMWQPLLWPRERGSGVENRRSVTSAVGAWLPSQPCQLHFSTLPPPLCSHTASGIRDCSCLPGCPSPVPALSGFLPAPLKLLWLSDPSGCRGGREELSSCSCPDRPWGLLLTAMPCAQDRSCFEERSCQSGLGLLSACGVGGWEGCSFSQLHSCPPAWDLRAGLPSSRWRSPPLTGAAAEWAAPLGHDQGLVLAQRVGRACQAGSGPGIVSRERGPRWHPHAGTASPGAPSFFMRRSLLCDRRLLMLNALIRRDKTTLKIPRCRPPKLLVL